MYYVDIKAMPDNPAGKIIGDSSGKWYVYSQYEGSGSIIEKGHPIEIHGKDLTFEEAEKLADKISKQLNGE